ncbi:tetraspanin-2-like [Thalictrum thalictroides]|uniref:Tetraspanin-2-like n=1 Tax=Thalictrum thalictroides TaxID=46969 RepID=A0A7J6URT3_THATH|nr:tetraspanin-2-like [Thalictrum thalictroides]
MAFSNNVTAIFNFFVIIFLVVIRSTSLPHDRIYCIFGVYLDIIGIFILLVAFAGLVGALGNRKGFLDLYILAIFLLLIFVFVTFFSINLWLQTEVTDSDNWSKIRTCVLGRSDVCSKLGQEYASADQFFSCHLSPIQVVSAYKNAQNKAEKSKARSSPAVQIKT